MIDIIKKLRKFEDDVQNGVALEELDEIIDDLEYRYEDLLEESIIDLDKFKRKLNQANLLTPELENFIENYMRFDNN